MKELIKPGKKTTVYERLNVTAFHEDGGSYSRGGTYSKVDGYTNENAYSERNSVDLDDDLLF